MAFLVCPKYFSFNCSLLGNSFDVSRPNLAKITHIGILALQIILKLCSILFLGLWSYYLGCTGNAPCLDVVCCSGFLLFVVVNVIVDVVVYVVVDVVVSLVVNDVVNLVVNVAVNFVVNIVVSCEHNSLAQVWVHQMPMI